MQSREGVQMWSEDRGDMERAQTDKDTEGEDGGV